uniref:GMP synthase (glutamine-hydrolyzing) n=1 Tax=Haemonchus contortus TaxID=6289 RepID=A0A7I4Y1S6_HAECO
IKIGGQTSKNHSLRSEKHRSTRVAAVSRLSDMKRANSSVNGDECVPTKNNTNGHPQPPPHKRLNSATLEAQRMEKMGINGAGDGHADIDRVAVLDFGAQYGKVIDRRVREASVLSEMFPLKTSAKEILKKGNFKAIIISGGPNSVYVEGSAQPDPELFLCGLPILGICYGFQLINKAHGGDVAREQVREDGQCKVWLDTSCELFHGLNESEEVLLTHGDSVTEKTVAPGFKVVAKSGGHVAGIACPEKRLYGVQFHPEVDLTPSGRKMFDNFLFRISGCSSSYTMANREHMCIEEIRKTVGDKKVLVLVSGGVDSSVCAALLGRALGPSRVTAIHIDNGFMRKDESDHVIESLKEIDLPVHREYAGLKFMVATASGKTGEGEPLDRTVDPELKRQIIGNTFIRVKDRVMEELKLEKEDYFLAQGTLRPDLIESASEIASGHADVIKTHHNDTALVRELRASGRVIEPLKDFHKDEVRELGRTLGLPEQLVNRQPFPGPGLAIRIICAQKPHICNDFGTTHQCLNVLTNLRRQPATALEVEYREKMLAAMNGWEISELMTQSFVINATLLPIKTVGVQGDSRSYSYVAALSTAQQTIPWQLLARYAVIIPKLLHNINRVVYVFGGPVNYPVTTITPTYLNAFTVKTLQEADHLATEALYGRRIDGSRDPELEDLSKKVQQMPVVMIPVHFDRPPTEINSYKRSFVLRPFITSDFMTGIAALPGRDIPEKNVLEMVRRIRTFVKGTSRVMIDLTSKPPGTTEWE